MLQIQDLTFHRRGVAVLQGLSLQQEQGEVLVVIGGSGSGKTTLLRLIAGLERPSSGSISLGKQVLSGQGLHVAPEHRNTGMVFQGLALFPHLTAMGNIEFGLAHLPKAERAQRVAEELSLVGLEGLGDRYPHQLSGGQQQRVAIARSLAKRPALLLLDEPFSDLDQQTRQQVRQEVMRILRAHGTTAIVVTHDREDALQIGDRIGEMENGRVVRLGPPSAYPHSVRQDTTAPIKPWNA
jgi:iron(III) transport system ATP-binding protein